MKFDKHDRKTWVDKGVVGQRIRKLRLKYNLTVEEFSDSIMVDRSAYIRWVMGEHYPSKYTVDEMIRCYPIKIEDIFGHNSKLDKPSFDIDKTYVVTPWHDSKFSAKRINKLMDMFNVDVNTLAKSLKVTPSAIRYWRRGASYPSAESTKRLAKFFNMTESELINGK